MDFYVSDLLSIVFLIVGLVFLAKKEVNLTFQVGTRGNETIIQDVLYSKPIKLEGLKLKIIGLLITIISGLSFIYICSGDLLWVF